MYNSIKRQFESACHSVIHNTITSGNVVNCLVSNVPRRNRTQSHIEYVQVVGICINGYIDTCGKVWKYASVLK